MNNIKTNSALSLLRLTGFLEGLSFIILLCIAMPLKYWGGKPEAVKIVGMGHGVLFIAYVIFLLWATVSLKWSLKKATLGFIAAFIPLGTFWADYKLFRN
jgi:integral membrane protein